MEAAVLSIQGVHRYLGLFLVVTGLAVLGISASEIWQSHVTLTIYSGQHWPVVLIASLS